MKNNRTIILVLLLGFFYIVFGCREVQYFSRVDYKAFYINETTDTIYMVGICFIHRANSFPSTSGSRNDTFEILPNATLIAEGNNVEITGGRNASEPNTDNFNIILPTSCHIFYKNANQCDYGRDEDGIVARTRFFRIENYENRKEISPLNFEFTYRFTEEVKAEAGECL